MAETLRSYILQGLKGKFFISKELLLGREEEYKDYQIVYEITEIMSDGLIAKVYPDANSYFFLMQLHLGDRESTLEEVQRAKESALASKTK